MPPRSASGGPHTYPSLLKKPTGDRSFCHGCVLEHSGHGFSHSRGPDTAPIAFLAEAPGPEELRTGTPLVGPAGSMHARLLKMIGKDQDNYKLDNVIRCLPPFMELAGTPYEAQAIARCRYRDATLANPAHQVIVTLGSVATRTMLGVGKEASIEDLHGTVHRVGDKWVVPTYHPSHLQRGAHHLMGVVLFDLQRAEEVAAGQWRAEDPGTIVEDPPLDWFTAWVDMVEAAWQRAPGSFWTSCDIETPDKAGGKSEGELTPDDLSYVIERVNWSCNPDEGVTVPYIGPYIDQMNRLFALGLILGLWNEDYDLRRLANAGHRIPDVTHDGMEMWHMLQSDLPRGLGFVAPFYSTFGAWKHLAKERPAWYGGVDGLQNQRTIYGVAADLQKMGQWEAYERHVRQVRAYALRPAEHVGLKIDEAELDRFIADMTNKARTAMQAIQPLAPLEVCPLQPESGLKKPPTSPYSKSTDYKKDGTLKKKSGDELKLELFAAATLIEKLVLREITHCTSCGKTEIAKTHRCEDKTLTPAIALVTATVTRWFWQEPFNPDSRDQVLAYVKFKGHQPGRAKKTHNESVDRKTLQRLWAQTADPLYKHLIDLRAVQKVRGTYGIGMKRRLRSGRVHGRFTFKPSTQRLSSVDPNLTNVVGDKGDSNTLAHGFRKCVVAEPGCRLLECVAPETQILKTDLTWVRADSIQLDDELLAFDAVLNGVLGTGKGRGHAHRFQAGRVTNVSTLRRSRVRVTTSHGSTIVATNHPFVARNDKQERRWITAENLRPGMRMAFLAEPWEIDQSREAGYLAGFFDGEGWIGRVNVGYAQNKGPTLDYVQALLRTRGVEFRQSAGNSTAQCEITNGIRPTLRFLGTIRPPRLMRKARQIWEGRRTWGKQSPVCRVLSVEFLEEGPVIAIETTSKTYISDGFFSHNCDYAGIEALLLGWISRDRDYVRLAKLGPHACLAYHAIGQPPDLTRPDDELAALFAVMKADQNKGTISGDPFLYDRSKRVVHGTGYGLTEYGMHENWPTFFPTLAHGKKLRDIFYDQMAPKIRDFHKNVRMQAHNDHFLGGATHPFGYRHWFWSVLSYRMISMTQKYARQQKGGWCTEINGRSFAVEWGEDAKRCLPLDTKVWMGDFSYKRLGDIQIGETVIGWRRGTKAKLPSHGTSDTKYMRGGRKQFTTDGLVRTTVTATHQLQDRTLTIVLASGRKLRCTHDHQWLGQRRHGYRYIRADHLKVGDQLCRVDVSDPGDCPENLHITAAWLGGFYDGEGSHRYITQRTDSHGNLLDRAKDAYTAMGFETVWRDQPRDPPWNDCTNLAWLGGRQAALKFVRWVPSYRYRAQWADRMILGNRFRKLDTVVAIEENPLVETVGCITTETGNFIADDFCSHNSIAFFPQSIAAGILKEALLKCFTPGSPYYIGDAYYGRTPLRAPIHDSLLLEVPIAVWDAVVWKVITAMRQPLPQLPLPAEWGMGEYLTVGVDAKASVDGGNWGEMETLDLDGISVTPTTVSDATVLVEDEDDEEMPDSLGTVVGVTAT